MSARRSIFENAPPLDTSGFSPKSGVDLSAPKPAAIREVAERLNFSSREATSLPLQPEGEQKVRRRRSCRTAQLSVKASPDIIDRFYKIAEEKDWLVTKTFEKAVAALEREVAHEAR